MTSASNFINVTYLLHGNPNDLRHLLSYPITTVPLSLAHIDDTPLKTDKATLTKALERRQHVVFVDTNLPSIKATISDGWILLYERVMQHSKSTYATMARDLLVKVCSHRDESTTRHIQVSIHQGCWSETGGYGIQNAFTITGPDQAKRQSGTERLKNGAFNGEFASFLMIEWKKDHYGPVIGNKTIYISHGGKMHDDAEQQRTWPGDHWAGEPSESTRRSWNARRLSCKTITWGKHTDKVDRHGCPGDSSWACRKISRK